MAAETALEPARWSVPAPGELGHHGDIFVAAAAQVDDHDIALTPVVPMRQDPRDGMRAFERRQNPLEPGQPRERVQGFPVRDRLIQYASRVLEKSVLGPYPRVVETRR